MSSKGFNLLKTFGTDVDKTDNGAWVAVSEGVSFKLARLNRPEYVAYRTKIQEEHSVELTVLRSTQKYKELEALSAKLYAKVLANTIVKDWEGVTYDGDEIPFTVEACENLLSDPRMVDLVNHLTNLANSRETFRLGEIEDAAKN